MAKSKLHSKRSEVFSKILFHELDRVNFQHVPSTVKTLPKEDVLTRSSVYAQYNIPQSWDRFKAFLSDHQKSSAVVTSLFLLELESYIGHSKLEHNLDISADELKTFDLVLARFEDICMQRLLLKFERFKLFSLQPKQIGHCFQDENCAEENYIHAMKVISSFCGLSNSESKFLNDIIVSRDDIEDLSREKLISLIKLLHNNDKDNLLSQTDKFASIERERMEDPKLTNHGKEDVLVINDGSDTTKEDVLVINDGSDTTKEADHKFHHEAKHYQMTESQHVNNQKSVQDINISDTENCYNEDEKLSDKTPALTESSSITNLDAKKQCNESVNYCSRQPSPKKHDRIYKSQRSNPRTTRSSTYVLHPMTSKRPSRTCPICGSEFKTTKSMKSHLKAHTKEVHNKCSLCSKPFKLRATLKEHQKVCVQNKSKCSSNMNLYNGSVSEQSSISNLCPSAGSFSKKQTLTSNKKQPLTSNKKQTSTSKPRTDAFQETLSCGVCDKIFPDSARFRSHMKCHSKGKLLECDICHSTCRGPAKLARHKLTHSGEKPFHCQICNAAFADKSHLNVHLRVHSGEKPFKCDICQSSFSESTKLKNHKRVHTGEKPFVCEVCGTSFSVSSSLKSHMKIHSGHRPYQCDLCDFASTHSSNLKAHMLIHTGERKFTCDTCGASFTETAKLKRHKMVHTGERPYSCEVCGTRFADKSHLTVHLRIHSGDKPFKCTYCTSSFAESSKLKNHLRTHTGEKPYICEVCGMSFAVSYSLKSHMRRHTGEKPYKCKVCGYATSQSSNLKTHMLVHNGKRAHVCDECGASFSETSKLNRHKQIHLDLEEKDGDSVHVATLNHDSGNSHFQTGTKASTGTQGLVHSNLQNVTTSQHTALLANSKLQEATNMSRYAGNSHSILQADSETTGSKLTHAGSSHVEICYHPSYSGLTDSAFQSNMPHYHSSAFSSTNDHQAQFSGTMAAPGIDRQNFDSGPFMFNLYKGDYVPDANLHIDLGNL